jgi:hypothetical protein
MERSDYWAKKDELDLKTEEARIFNQVFSKRKNMSVDTSFYTMTGFLFRKEDLDFIENNYDSDEPIDPIDFLEDRCAEYGIEMICADDEKSEYVVGKVFFTARDSNWDYASGFAQIHPITESDAVILSNFIQGIPLTSEMSIATYSFVEVG